HARIITGFQRSAPNVSNITVHTAPILFGSLYGYDNSGLAPIAQSLSDSGIPSELSDQIGEALWAKLLYNTTLNPLGAILRVPYGVLAACPSSHAIMDGLIEESFAVMHAAGYRTFWETPEQYREAFYGKLVPDTKDHRASTLQDIEKGCPTEIRTLNGCIVDMADKLGIDVPQHRMIVRLIGAIEENMDKPR
ncbi:MAG: ketopantoate reductase family protein, partial [Butyricicoccaceae bacterium]